MTTESGDNGSGDNGGNNNGSTPPENGFSPITTQDDLNRVIDERLKRERAKFSDYAEAKAAQKKLGELEDANRSAEEKTAKRIADLESELTAQRTDSLRRRIASERGITDAEDIELFLTGTDEETLRKQAQRLADRTAERKKSGNHVPREGRQSPPPAADDARETVRTLFGTG